MKRFWLASTLMLMIFCYAAGAAETDEKKWSGVDETVIERVAEKAGRKPWKPFINTDQGDLLLFCFLSAGIVGGFVMGYYYRSLFVDKSDLKNPREHSHA